MQNNEKISEIKAIVGRLAEIQQARELSDNQLRREFPDIGSTKTWRSRLLAGKFDDINVDRQLLKLRRVAAILDGGSPDEVYYPDMPFSLEMKVRLAKLEHQTNDRRILVCLAPNGTGKSAFARWAVGQKRSTRCYIRIRPTWRNKKVHICTGFAKAMGKSTSTTNASDIEAMVIEGMNEGEPKTFFVDQAHEGGVDLMHEMRAFVDESPARFVYLAYPTAYNRVQTGTTDALIEAKAFIGRCLKPAFDLYKDGIQSRDAQYYLTTVAGLSKSLAESVSARIVPVLRAHTNLRLLDDAISAAESAADANGNWESLADLIVKEVTNMAGATAGALKAEALAEGN